MTKEIFDNATVLLSRITHLEDLLKILDKASIDGSETRQTGFSIEYNGSHQENIIKGELEVIKVAFKKEINRLKTEFNML